MYHLFIYDEDSGQTLHHASYATVEAAMSTYQNLYGNTSWDYVQDMDKFYCNSQSKVQAYIRKGDK